jgi:uncharacterized protein with PIN domain
MYARSLNKNRRELKYLKTVRLRFYAELNNFLPVRQRQKSIDYSFPGPITIKEVIESMKVPPAEVDLILVNGKPVDYNYHVNQSDYISIYPVFEHFDISTISQLRKAPLRISKFILDAHLGKLAKYLRMFGFDTLYKNDFSDNAIREIACQESRIILTRDRDLLNSKDVTHGYYVRAIHPKEQLAEIIDKFDLYSQVNPFSRCINCNNPLIEVDKNDIRHEIEADTWRFFDDFYKCSVCNKIYWKGSHYEHMNEFISQNLNKSAYKDMNSIKQ